MKIQFGHKDVFWWYSEQAETYYLAKIDCCKYSFFRGNKWTLDHYRPNLNNWKKYHVNGVVFPLEIPKNVKEWIGL